MNKAEECMEEIKEILEKYKSEIIYSEQIHDVILWNKDTEDFVYVN